MSTDSMTFSISSVLISGQFAHDRYLKTKVIREPFDVLFSSVTSTIILNNLQTSFQFRHKNDVTEIQSH